MEKHGIPRAFLGIAGHLAIPVDEIGITSNGYFEVLGLCQALRNPPHDELVGGGYRLEFGSVVDGEDKRVIEAAWALDHGSTAADPTVDRHAILPATVGMNLGMQAVSETDDDAGFTLFPEEQTALGVCGIADLVKNELLQGQLFGRVGEVW